LGGSRDVSNSDGATRVRSGKREVEVRFEQFLYRIYGFIHHGGDSKWTCAAVTPGQDGERTAALIR